MAHTLTVCEGEYQEWSYQSPSSATIDKAINGLIPAMFHFAILEAVPPLDNCAYVQTLILDSGKAKGQYLVEARYKFPEGVRHYKTRIRDADEVKRVFRKFAEGVAPNVAGWRDITEKMIAATA
jgi:hypothetical protein